MDTLDPRLADAFHRVWNAIGGDVAAALGEQGITTISTDEIIELALEEDRLIYIGHAPRSLVDALNELPYELRVDLARGAFDDEEYDL